MATTRERVIATTTNRTGWIQHSERCPLWGPTCSFTTSWQSNTLRTAEIIAAHVALHHPGEDA